MGSGPANDGNDVATWGIDKLVFAKPISNVDRRVGVRTPDPVRLNLLLASRVHVTPPLPVVWLYTCPSV